MAGVSADGVVESRDIVRDRCVDSPEVKQAIAQLLERKRSGQELDREPRITVLSDFIQSEFAHLV